MYPSLKKQIVRHNQEKKENVLASGKNSQNMFKVTVMKVFDPQETEK